MEEREDKIEEELDEVDEVVDTASSEDNADNVDIPDEDEGRIFEKNRDKTPLFVIEPKAPDCARDDRLYLIAKKIGFFGLVSCLILSIVFGAITKLWRNSLNLLFMALAVLSYGIQEIIHLKSISKCTCSSCTIERKKLKNIIILCVTVAAILIVLFGVKQFATF